LLGTEGAFDVMVRARRVEAEGRPVVHREIGEPDFPTPSHIVEAGIEALRRGRTRYAPPAGTSELREAIAQSMRERGIPATAEHVVVTPGAKPVIFFAILTLVDRGDEVLLPSPGFPIFESVVRFAGGRPIPYRVDPARADGIDPDAIAAALTPRTRLLVLNTPHNPTGSTIDPEALGALGELVLRHGLMVLSDEIYSRHRYDGAHASIAALSGLLDRTVVVDGFSKTFAMTGWRLGFGVMPAAIAERVIRLVVNSNSCTATFVQDAGVAALTGSAEPVSAMCQELRKRRNFLVEGLDRISGVRCAVPRGAFFAFPDVRLLLERTGLSSAQLADRLLEHHGVACLPGTAFGPGGEGYLRLSYATSMENLALALDALRACADGLSVAQ
jgi:aspartate aminotransferase